MQLALGSTNPAKRRAVLLATGHEPVCVAVPSGVNDQPMSADETIRGAIVRARAALAAVADAQIGLGLEGGVDFDAHHTRQWYLLSVCAAWDGRDLYVAHGVRMPLPQAVGVRLAAGGIELAAIMDALGGTTASNHKDGAYGLLSSGRINRAEVFRDAVIAALAPFGSALYRTQAGD
jgi:inosine/xanthosine triphosphatase